MRAGCARDGTARLDGLGIAADQLEAGLDAKRVRRMLGFIEVVDWRVDGADESGSREV